MKVLRNSYLFLLNSDHDDDDDNDDDDDLGTQFQTGWVSEKPFLWPQ